MKKVRRAVIWVALLGIAFLAAMSILGAFIGDERARMVFNSAPLSVFWILLFVLMAAGLALFRRLRRSPGLLAVHLGCILIILGSMWASDAGHRLADTLLGRKKIPSGYMVIHEGQTSSRVLVSDLNEESGKLRFSLELVDFSIERYPAEDESWKLVMEAVHSEGDAGEPLARHANVEWVLGEETELSFINADVRVLEYLEGSRRVYREDEAELLITEASGEESVVAAQAGREIALADSEAVLRIVRRFSHLIVRGTGEEREVVDLPDSTGPPALQVEIEYPDGEKERRYVMAGFPMHGQAARGLQLSYELPMSVEADPQSDLPAMEVLATRGDREVRGWLVAQKGARHAHLSLAPLLSECTPEEHAMTEGACCQGAGHPEAASLYLVEPLGPVSDYKSHLVVLEEGQPVLEKVIEVNRPLHYQGYHFYQHSYDRERGHYTILSVRSDSGLPIAYAGFAFLGVGTFLILWIEPVWVFLLGRRNDGH